MPHAAVATLPPIQLAFYDGLHGGPGHYMAVLPVLSANLNV